MVRVRRRLLPLSQGGPNVSLAEVRKVLLESTHSRTSNTLTVPAQEHFYVRRAAQPSDSDEKTRSARRAASDCRGLLNRPEGLRCGPGPKGVRYDTSIGVDLNRSREQCRGDLNETFAGA